MEIRMSNKRNRSNKSKISNGSNENNEKEMRIRVTRKSVTRIIALGRIEIN
jgi:hypothetical protein